MLIKLTYFKRNFTYLKPSARANIGATSPLVPLQRKTTLILLKNQEASSDWTACTQTNLASSNPSNLLFAFRVLSNHANTRGPHACGESFTAELRAPTPGAQFGGYDVTSVRPSPYGNATILCLQPACFRWGSGMANYF